MKKRPAMDMYPMIDVICFCFAAHNMSPAVGESRQLDMSARKEFVLRNLEIMARKTVQDPNQDVIDSRLIEQAQEAIDEFKSIMTLRILKNQKTSDFRLHLLKLLENTEASILDVGALVYFPDLWQSAKDAQVKEEKIQELSYSSQFLGNIGDKINFVLTVLETRYLSQFNCHAVTGTDDAGNLITFLTSKDTCLKSGKYTGKINDTKLSSYHNNARVTNLNFVKAVS